jgi:enoyl-CoA hydratase
MTKHTKLTVNENIATLTLQRPEALNAIDETMIIELNGALDKIEKDVDIRVLIITGTGKSFCAGADTKVFLQKTAQESQEFLESILQLFQRFEQIEIPVIAAINGYAFGGGAQLAIASDIRIASEQSSFRFPGASYGLVISGHLLPTIVGVPKAKELLFSSRILSAQEALQIGLVNQLVSSGNEYDTALEMARRVCDNPDSVVRQIKKVINDSIGRIMEERLELEDRSNQLLMETGEYRSTFESFVLELRKKKSNGTSF